MSYTVLEPNPRLSRASVLGLWRRNLPMACEERYAWLYEWGPALGWTLNTDAESVVGSAGLMERTIHVAGQPRRGGQAIDLNVDRKHRSLGPAMKLQRAVIDAAANRRIGLIYAFPDRNSQPVLSHLGYQLLGTVSRWVKPLKCPETTPPRLQPSLLRKPATAATNSLLWLTSPDTFFHRPAPGHVEVTDYFDSRFDTLWQEVDGRYGAIGERTADYLNWRFYHCPTRPHRAFCLEDPEGRLLAYLVYSRRGETAHVSDFLFVDLRAFNQVFAEFLRQMRREKAKTVVAVFFGSPRIAHGLARFGFWKRPTDWQAMLHLDEAPLPPDRAQLLDPETWFFTRADIDTDD